MPFPFELRPEELAGQIEDLVDAVWGSLQSNFLTLPRGPGFLEYERFAAAHDILLTTTKRFEDWRSETVWAAFQLDPLVFYCGSYYPRDDTLRVGLLNLTERDYDCNPKSGPDVRSAGTGSQ